MRCVRPTVIQTENLPQECSDWLSERCDLHICPSDSLRFRELLPSTSGLVVRTYTTVDREMIKNAPILQVVGRAGVGLDNIDLLTCKENAIKVVYTPEANNEAVVEFVLTNLLPLLRPTPPIDSVVGKEQWQLFRDETVCPKQFNEMTLGIVGFGRVGSRLGKVAKDIGFHVIYNDIKIIGNNYGCESVDIKTLLCRSDAISIHVDGRPENKHLCNKVFFESMNQFAPFVNTSRGHVVNPTALASHLIHNKEACAVLDVHETEPFNEGYPLLGLDNAILYPHIAAKTKTANKNMGWVVRDVISVLNGDAPKFEAFSS
jgi:phosphoglycerate dehydrogenase-like enzyme